MPTKHCKDCEPNSPCGKGHLYVLELGNGIERHYAVKSEKGYLYVGSTGKSVEQRFRDNLTQKDGTVVSLDEAREALEDGQWKYNSKNSKRIRKHYVRHRPDLLYFKANPITVKKGDPKCLARRELRLATRLRNRNYSVEGPKPERSEDRN